MIKLRRILLIFLISMVAALFLRITAYAVGLDVEITHTEYSYAADFSEGMAAVRVGKKWGFIDESFREIVPLKYERAGNFSEGLAGFRAGGKWGFIDRTGKEVIRAKYDMVWEFRGGMAAVELDEKFGFIDKNGKEVVPLKYDAVGGRAYAGDSGKFPGDVTAVYNHEYCFVGDVAVVWLGGKCGFIDKTGNEITPVKYTDARRFSEGMTAVKFGDKWGFF